MKEKVSASILWNEAARAGILLGLLPIVCSLTTSLVSRLGTSGLGGAAIASVLNFFIWAVKFGGCIFLMKISMERLVRKYDGVTNSDTLGLGVRTAFLSAMLVAAYTLASYMLISPEALSEQIDSAVSAWSSMMDSNSLSQLDELKSKLPTYSFFIMLIYCFVYGWILSAILSRRIPSDNPFDDENTSGAGEDSSDEGENRIE